MSQGPNWNSLKFEIGGRCAGLRFRDSTQYCTEARAKKEGRAGQCENRPGHGFVRCVHTVHCHMGQPLDRGPGPKMRKGQKCGMGQKCGKIVLQLEAITRKKKLLVLIICILSIFILSNWLWQVSLFQILNVPVNVGFGYLIDQLAKVTFEQSTVV